MCTVYYIPDITFSFSFVLSFPCLSLYSLFMIFLISIVYQKLLGLMMPHGLNSLMLSLTGKNDSIPDYITCNLE